MEKVMKFFGAAVLFAGGIILLIPLGAVCGYLAGLVLKFFVGGWIVDGLNILLNTTRFTTSHIPVICATLAVVGTYMRTTVTSKT